MSKVNCSNCGEDYPEASDLDENGRCFHCRERKDHRGEMCDEILNLVAAWDANGRNEDDAAPVLMVIRAILHMHDDEGEYESQSKLQEVFKEWVEGEEKERQQSLDWLLGHMER